MRGCVVPSAALALLLVAGLASAAPIKLRVGFYNTSTPMSAFEGAVLDGVCTNLGVNCVITQLNLENDTVADLVNGTEDMTMGQFTVSPDRAQLVDFVQPYYYSAALGIYSTPQAGPTLAEPPTARWEGLRGKPVCIVAGHYFQQREFMERYRSVQQHRRSVKDQSKWDTERNIFFQSECNI